MIETIMTLLNQLNYLPYLLLLYFYCITFICYCSLVEIQEPAKLVQKIKTLLLYFWKMAGNVPKDLIEDV